MATATKIITLGSTWTRIAAANSKESLALLDAYGSVQIALAEGDTPDAGLTYGHTVTGSFAIRMKGAEILWGRGSGVSVAVTQVAQVYGYGSVSATPSSAVVDETARASATAAQNTASAASATANTAQATASAAQTTAANAVNALPFLPARFDTGLAAWTSSTTGAPTATLPNALASVVSNDSVFGVSGGWAPTGTGNGFYAKGVVPWDRPWKVTAKIRVTATSDASTTCGISIRAIGLDALYGSAAANQSATVNVPADGSVVNLSATFSPIADDGADYNPTNMAASAFARFGIVRSSGTGTWTVRIESIRIEDATLELALRRLRSEVAVFASRAAAIAAVIPASAQSIGVVHDGVLLRYIRKPAAMASTGCPLITAGAQAWVPAADATLRHWGAVGDCVPATWTGTDNRAAFQAMLAWAALNDIRKVRINRGHFLIEKTAGTGVVVRYSSENLEIVGEGMWASNLYYKDLAISATSKPMISKLTTSTKKHVRLDGFSITSDWGVGGNWGEGSHAVSIGGGYGSVFAHQMRFQTISSMCLVASGSDSVHVTDCVFDTSQRDAIHVTGCRNVHISGNRFKSIGDDSISAPTTNDSIQFSEKIVVTGNTFEDCQGIYVVSTQSTIVTNNILIRPTIRGIQAGRASGVWAASAIPSRVNILIEGNFVTDVLKRARFGGTGQDYAYISVVDVISDGVPSETEPPVISPTADGSYVFGPNGSGGITAPDAYFYTRENLIGNLNIQVKNNICMRTLNPVPAYTDYGFGPRYVQNVGPYTGSVIEADFYDRHYQFKGTIRNCLFEGNISYGAGTPVTITDYMNGTPIEADNLIVRNNILTNFSGAAAVDYDGNAIILAEGNVIDGDPLHRHANRSANGTWTSGITPAAYRATKGKILVKGGSVKNVGGVLAEASGGKVSVLSAIIVAGDLAGFGDLAASKGIRHVPRGIPVDYAKTNSDPSLAGFGQTLSVTERYADAVPTSGHYLEGQVVMRPHPQVVSGALVQGWVRMTTGSAHVLGTDWREIRATVA